MAILDDLNSTDEKVENVTIGSYFKDENVNGGIFEKSNFVTEIRKAVKADKLFLAHSIKGFKHMQQRHRVSNVPEVTCENGQEAIWLNFRYGNTSSNVRLPAVTGMLELLTDYAQRGRIITVSFEDLIQYAAGEI